MFTILYRPNFFLNIPIPCYIFIKQMSLFVVGGGVSTYFMFYVNIRRLNNSVLTRFMRTHAFFFFCRQCCRTFPCFSWSLVDVLTRIVLTTGTWVHDFFFSILSIKCAFTTYMNPFDMLRCEINAFMNYAPFS